MKREQIVAEILDIAERYSDDVGLRDDVVEPLYHVAKRLHLQKTSQVDPQAPQMAGDGSPVPTLNDVAGISPTIDQAAAKRQVQQISIKNSTIDVKLQISGPVEALNDELINNIQQILNKNFQDSGLNFVIIGKEKVQVA